MSAWLGKQKAALAEEGKGDLEAQKAGAEAQHNSFRADGPAKLQAVERAADALEVGGLTAENKTPIKMAALKVEHAALQTEMAKKVASIEGEIARQKGMEVSPEALAEFKESFDHFDKNKNGALNALEFRGCLQAMGRDPTEQEVAQLLQVLDKDGSGSVAFNEFLNYMVQTTQDQGTADELISAFRSITNDAPFIEESQMRANMDGALVDYLITVLPKVDGGYNYKAWTKSVYK